MTAGVESRRSQTVLWRAVAFVAALAAAFVFVEVVEFGIHLLWHTLPEAMPNDFVRALVCIALVTGAGWAVGTVRAREGLYGHSPLDGLVVRADPLRTSILAVGVILISLLGGAVLGPEAGLIAVGTAVAGAVSKRISMDADPKLLKAAVLGAVLALVLPLWISGSLSLGGPPVELGVGLLWVLPVSALAASLVAVIRTLAFALRSRIDTRSVRPSAMAGVGLLVGAVGAAGILVADVEPSMIFGSGEGEVPSIAAETSLLVLITVIVTKSIAYLLCLGGGFRGGPIFPALFLGGAVAALAVALGLPTQIGPLAVGCATAALSVGMSYGWRGLGILGVVFGLLLGSVSFVLPAIVGALIGGAVARVLTRVPGVAPVPDLADPVG